MPQASDEQREKWGGGEWKIGEEKAISFLESHGFVLRRDWRWQKPSPDRQITSDEYEAAKFLVDEWDFGGFI